MNKRSNDAPALRITGLVKHFGARLAVDDLGLVIPQGEFHALLGPNGAGKTTTLRIVAGLLKADSGSAQILGCDIATQPTAAKRLMAFLPDDPMLYGKLRPIEYLEFVAGLWDVAPDLAAPRAEELLRWLDLWGNTGELIEGFSRGMRQKLALAGALIHDPQLLILDEPLTGLDAAAARQVKDLLVARVAGGQTVLLTTHILEVAERLAQCISIVQHGRIIAQGSLDELRSTAATREGSQATLEDVFLQLTQAVFERSMKLRSARPGSAAWLLQHELTLTWRGVGLRHARAVGLVCGLLWTLAHVVAFPALNGIRDAGTPPWAVTVVGAMTWLVMSLMLSQAIMLSVSALFVRGDLDLLLSSPMPARSVFVVRGLGVAVSCTVLYLALLSPLADLGPLTGRAGLLAIYPTLVAMGLAMTALAMLLTLWLVRLLGARRARTAAQLLGALVGAAMFLGTQAHNLVDDGRRARLDRIIAGWMADGGPLAPDSALWWPGRAMLGEPGPLALVLAIGVSGFWLVMRLAHRRFVAGTQESLTAVAPRGGATATRVRLHAGLWRNVLAKEWRLIRRDPQLISQTLLQTLYLLPLMFLAFRHDNAFAVVVPGAVMFGASLTGSLAWVTVAAEDAPDLIGTAPVAMARIRRMKLAAAMLPVWLLLSPLLLLMVLEDPRLAMIFFACAIGGSVSAGAMQIGYPRRGDRRDMKKRSQGSLLIGLLETFTGIAWAATAYCLIEAWRYTPWALLPALSGPAVVWWIGKARREANQRV